MGWRWPTSLLPLLLLTACVTINIYFPAAAAEKAADRIIQEVWGDDPRPPPAAGKEQSRLDTPAWRRFGSAWLDLLVAPAQAAEADLNIASPAIDRLKAAMRQRHGDLEAHYRSGAIGLTADGRLALRDPSAVGLRDRNRVNTLVADENRDRAALYREIARANGKPEWQADIQSTFARRWVDNAPAGWWYQSGGTWAQKR